MPGVEDVRRGFGTIHSYEEQGEVIIVMEIDFNAVLVLKDTGDADKQPEGIFHGWDYNSQEPETHSYEEDE